MKINPLTLLKRLDTAINNTPRIIKEVMEEREEDLIELNKQNLMQGKDNKGMDMPRYRNAEYAHFKTSINPKNRGFWDLRVTGEYQKMIKVKIHASRIFFKNNLQNKKAQFLEEILGKRHLGVMEEQMERFQIENKPEAKKRLLKIINRGV